MSSSNQRVTRSQSRGDSAQSAVEPSREEMKSCDNTQDDDSVMSNTDKYASTDESCDSEPTTVKYVLL